ncbi:MAG TPA: hypothetical protein VK892_18550 [Pyrinomonadaceae bacterium]|nr:hypothetical protein [Pyrinomonadaceae bacterium]
MRDTFLYQEKKVKTQGEKTMKFTLKLFLVVCLFSSVAFAEGDMGSGGYTCEGDMGSGGYTCEGDMTGGGITCDCETDPPTSDGTGSLTVTNTNQEEAENSILIFVQEYLNLLFGQ